MTKIKNNFAAKLIAIFLAAMLVIPAAAPAVYADSEPQPVPAAEVVEHELEFLYVESPTLEAPGTQNIAIAWNEQITGSDSIELIYSGNDGNEYAMTEKERTADSVLFSKEFTTGETGTYALKGLRYTVGGTEGFFDFNEVEIAASFAVVNNITEPAAPDNVTITDVSDGSAEIADQVSSTLEVSRPTLLPSAANDGKLIVVLDPGHGSREAGASGNGIKEHEAVSKIAKYCKAELETYEGIEVYVTHNGNGFSGDAATRMQARVDYAVSVNADALISLHINAGGGYGAEVWYPHANYVPEVHPIGQGLAQNIQNELVELGLRDRKIKTKETVNDKYPDGTVQDYYGIIRRCKLAGIPGIIVEHAFLDSQSDVENYLNSDEKLQTLAIADATGIANYYELKKKPAGTDVTPPVLNSYEYESESIQTPDTMRINIEVEDKDAAPEKVEVTLTNSTTGKLITSSDFHAKKGSIRNGYIDFSFPRYSNMAGTYYVSELKVTDSNGYQSIYNTYDSTLVKKTFTVEETEKADEITSTDKIDQTLETLEKAEEGTTVAIIVNEKTPEIPAEVFEAIAGKDITIVLEATSKENLAEGVGAQWIINGQDIDADKIKDIDATIQIVEADENQWKGDEQIGESFLRIIFPSNGELPGKFTIRIRPSADANEWMSSNNLKLYHLDKKTGEYVPVNSEVKDNGDGTYDFTISHNSEYAISYVPDPVTPPADDAGSVPSGSVTQTGDDFNMTIPIIAMIVALAGIAIAFFCRKSSK